MDFIIYYEIAAAFLLTALLVVYYTKRHLNTRLNKLFLKMTVSLLFVDIMDVATVLVNQMQMSSLNWLNYLLNILLFLLQILMYMLFFTFVLTMSEYSAKISDKSILILIILSIFYLILIVTSPISGAIFYIDNEGVYQYGFFHCIVYIMPCLSLIMGFCMLFGRRSHIKKAQFVSICLFTSLIIGSTIFQSLVMPHVLIAYFFAALGLLAIYLTFQSPEYYLDPVTDTFNEVGLYEILKENYQLGHFSFLIVLYPMDIEVICNSNERMAKDKVITVLVQYLETFSSNQASIYRLNEVLCLLFQNEEAAIKAANNIHTDFLKKCVRFNGEIPILTNMLLINSPQNFKDFDEAISFIQYFCQETIKNPQQSVVNCNDEFIKKKKRYDDIVTLLKTAIHTEAISVYYQPIYSESSQSFHSAEALVRLNDTTTIDLLYPDEFIPIAEKENLIFELEDIIIKTIFSFVKKTQIWNLGVDYIEINLSARQCLQIDFCDKIQTLLEKYKLNPSFFNFELTETAIIDSKEQVLQNINQLIQLGCSTSLDDFGSGYANINYLLTFPFQIIKLDKELIWSYFNKRDKKSKIVLSNIIKALNELDVRTVAEGIETKEMKDTMKEMGVNDFQGYYYSVPLNEVEYLQFLNDKKSSALY